MRDEDILESTFPKKVKESSEIEEVEEASDMRKESSEVNENSAEPKYLELEEDCANKPNESSENDDCTPSKISELVKEFKEESRIEEQIPAMPETTEI